MEGGLEVELCAQAQIAGLIEWAPLGGSHRCGNKRSCERRRGVCRGTAEEYKPHRQRNCQQNLEDSVEEAVETEWGEGS